MEVGDKGLLKTDRVSLGFVYVCVRVCACVSLSKEPPVKTTGLRKAPVWPNEAYTHYKGFVNMSNINEEYIGKFT
jgi:hypothetical protein